MKQTALEWLIEQFKEYDFEDSPTMYIMQIPSWVLEKKELQAKEMEKEQLQLAYASRCSFISCEGNDIEENINCKCGKQYYKETYNR